MLGGKFLDEMRKRKMMRRRKIVVKVLGFFPKPACFIYKQTLMGFLQFKGPIISMGFYSQPRVEGKTTVRATTRRRKVRYE
jgi:hypothetical protein